MWGVEKRPAYKKKRKDMKAILFNEYKEMCKVLIDNYKYKKFKSYDVWNGVYDIQEELSFSPSNYYEVKKFIKSNSNEINFAIYDNGENFYLYQPYVEYDDELMRIIFFKIKTNHF